MDYSEGEDEQEGQDFKICYIPQGLGYDVTFDKISIPAFENVVTQREQNTLEISIKNLQRSHNSTILQSIRVDHSEISLIGVR